MAEKEPKKIKCPECAVEIKLNAEPELGDIAVCNECGLEVEVTNLEPLEVEPVMEEK